MSLLTVLFLSLSRVCLAYTSHSATLQASFHVPYYTVSVPPCSQAVTCVHLPRLCGIRAHGYASHVSRHVVQCTLPDYTQTYYTV